MTVFELPTSGYALQVMHLIGDVKGKVAIMVDDMIDTAGWQSVLFPNFFLVTHIYQCIPSNIHFFILIKPRDNHKCCSFVKTGGS